MSWGSSGLVNVELAVSECMETITSAEAAGSGAHTGGAGALGAMQRTTLRAPVYLLRCTRCSNCSANSCMPSISVVPSRCPERVASRECYTAMWPKGDTKQVTATLRQGE